MAPGGAELLLLLLPPLPLPLPPLLLLLLLLLLLVRALPPTRARLQSLQSLRT
jgi:hypothetical protein